MLSEAEKLAGIGSFEWDIRRNRVTWSDGLYHIYGLKPQEFGVSFDAFLSLIDLEHRERVRKTIEVAAATGNPFEMEESIIRADGEERTLFSRGRVIRDKKGHPIRLIGVCQDITERKRAREQELRQKLIEADNARKMKELEEARKLQLFMLPKSLPDVPDLDIAVYTKTAEEVGGDYYDFFIEDDGTLTLAFGDATGHGLRAGTMVTATKSVFNALATIADPVLFLQKTSAALLRLGLRRVYMALIFAKYCNGCLTLASAGMPYALVYRAKEKSIEPIILKGMPLGRFPDYPYQQQRVKLHKGDAVLLMSDGLADRFNERGETFGEDRVQYVFSQTAQLTPERAIAALVKAGEQWANGQPQNDDITFLIIKKTN